jgi:hypothetical protein
VDSGILDMLVDGALLREKLLESSESATTSSAGFRP